MKRSNQEESVAGVIFSPCKKKVLLIQRRDVPVWALPGGGIEGQETPKTAIIREIQEETGYNVTIIKKIGEYFPKNRLARFTHLYLCKIESGAPMLTEETQGIRFFPTNSLPKMLPPPYPFWIRDAHLDRKTIIKGPIEGVNYRTFFVYLCKYPVLVLRFLCARLGLPIND